MDRAWWRWGCRVRFGSHGLRGFGLIPGVAIFDGREGESESGEVFFEAVGVVGFGFGSSRCLKEFATGGGDCGVSATGFDDGRELDSIESVDGFQLFGSEMVAQFDR